MSSIVPAVGRPRAEVSRTVVAPIVAVISAIIAGRVVGPARIDARAIIGSARVVVARRIIGPPRVVAIAIGWIAVSITIGRSCGRGDQASENGPADQPGGDSTAAAPAAVAIIPAVVAAATPVLRVRGCCASAVSTLPIMIKAAAATVASFLMTTSLALAPVCPLEAPHGRAASFSGNARP
jgi:hypothetical protein